MLRRSLASVFTLFGTLSGRALSREELGGSALVVAPHPDDEVLGCGGTIARKVLLGARVQVVIVTDGQASHRDRIAPADLVALRREEALRAAVALGLPESAYRFLDFPDHDLASHRSQAVIALRGIIDEWAPAEIYIPHRRDGLEDHVMTNEVVRQALEGYGRRTAVLEYPVWLWNTWPWTAGRRTGRLAWLHNLLDILHLTLLCRTRVEVGEVRHRKAAALREYRSQVERRDGDAGWPILADVSNGEFVECFDKRVEIFSRWVYRP